jgi:MHS family alpha-ketoglutarate permease-like MFS transporter
MVLGLVFLSGYTALSPIIKAELFPTKIRALGVGMPHALVAAAFGGTVESVALGFKGAGHESYFYWYVVGCVGLTLIATLFVQEPAERSTLERECPTITADEPLHQGHAVALR